MKLTHTLNVRILIALSLSCLLVGCATAPTRKPLPESLAASAIPPAMPNVRYWGDENPGYAQDWFNLPEADLRTRHEASFGKAHNYLAISGGGANGAYTAGILKGWTETEQRPEFTVVTGISTGALIAPFAFLGSDYDHVLEELYTQSNTRDLLIQKNPIAALSGSALSDSSPLQDLIARHVDEALMAEIAGEYRRGRALLITTTNLDAGRPVTWEVSKIAASGAPGALDLIRDVLLASASIPVAFPPVLIQVEAEGQIFDELHVDGGAASIVNLYPLAMDWGELMTRLQVPGKPNLYVIRNGFIGTEYDPTTPKLLDIASRSLSTLMSNVVIADFYRLHIGAVRDGLNFHLAFIPNEFDLKPKEIFDPEYMQALFDLGYEQGRQGYDWHMVPPDYYEQRN